MTAVYYLGVSVLSKLFLVKDLLKHVLDSGQHSYVRSLPNHCKYGTTEPIRRESGRD
jgi:hypothetical protein